MPLPASRAFPPKRSRSARAGEEQPREWFEPRKTVYEERVRAPMLELVAALNARMRAFARSSRRSPSGPCTASIAILASATTRRLTRLTSRPRSRGAVSRSTRRGLLSRRLGEGDRRRRRSLHASPEELRSIRLHLLENHAEFDRILSRPMVRKTLGSLAGEKLSRVPKGFPAEHPRPAWCNISNGCCGASWTGDGHHAPTIRGDPQALPRHGPVHRFSQRAARRPAPQAGPASVSGLSAAGLPYGDGEILQRGNGSYGCTVNCTAGPVSASAGIRKLT